MSNVITINEGATYEYIPHALAIFSIGGIFIPIFWYVTPIIWLIGIGMISISTGIDIIPENRQIRKYSNFLGLKRGQFISLHSTLIAKLIMNKNDTKFAIPVRNMAWREDPARITTFDLVLIDDLESEKVLIQFTKYSLAHKTMKALLQCEQLKVIDEVGLILEKQRKMRRR